MGANFFRCNCIILHYAAFMVETATIKPHGKVSLQITAEWLMSGACFLIAQHVCANCQKGQHVVGDFETGSHLIVNANPRIQHHAARHFLSKHLHADSPQREEMSIHGTGSRLSVSSAVPRGAGAPACAHSPTAAAGGSQGEDSVSRRRFFDVAGCGGTAAGIAIAGVRKTHGQPIQTVAHVTTRTNRTPGTALTISVAIMQPLCRNTGSSNKALIFRVISNEFSNILLSRVREATS